MYDFTKQQYIQQYRDFRNKIELGYYDQDRFPVNTNISVEDIRNVGDYIYNNFYKEYLYGWTEFSTRIQRYNCKTDPNYGFVPKSEIEEDKISAYDSGNADPLYNCGSDSGWMPYFLIDPEFHLFLEQHKEDVYIPKHLIDFDTSLGGEFSKPNPSECFLPNIGIIDISDIDIKDIIYPENQENIEVGDWVILHTEKGYMIERPREVTSPRLFPIQVKEVGFLGGKKDKMYIKVSRTSAKHYTTRSIHYSDNTKYTIKCFTKIDITKYTKTH